MGNVITHTAHTPSRYYDGEVLVHLEYIESTGTYSVKLSRRGFHADYLTTRDGIIAIMAAGAGLLTEVPDGPRDYSGARGDLRSPPHKVYDQICASLDLCVDCGHQHRDMAPCPVRSWVR